jgi:hypothetical protein
MERGNVMRIQVMTAGALVSVLLSGCVTHHPQTAEEFRQAVPGALTAKTETFEVNRPFRDVAATFRKKAPECLEVTVRTTSRTTTSHQVIVTEFKPTVVVTQQRAELHVQQHHKAGVVNVTKEPAGGYYVLVADAYPVDQNRTRVQMFRSSISHGVLIRAVREWATGENLGCPDMTKS